MLLSNFAMVCFILLNTFDNVLIHNYHSSIFSMASTQRVNYSNQVLCTALFHNNFGFYRAET